MDIKEVYEKYKHMDRVFSEGGTTFEAFVIRALWGAIKEELEAGRTEKALAAIRDYDPWVECEFECDPNPSDAFEQSSRYVKEFVTGLLKNEKEKQ